MHELARKVRPWTEGLRAIYVCNFRRGVKPESIRESFGFASLDMLYTDKQASKIKSLAERIKRGTYDIVIVRTKFISHYVENGIAQACRDNNVYYLRAGNASVAQIAQSAIRDMGIDFENPPVEAIRKPKPSLVVVPEETNEEDESMSKEKPSQEGSFEYDILGYVDGKDKVSMLEVLQAAGVDIPLDAKGQPVWGKVTGQMRAAGKVLSELGFVNMQVSAGEGRKERFWFRAGSAHDKKNKILPGINEVAFRDFAEEYIRERDQFTPREIFDAGQFGPLPEKDGKIIWTSLTRYTRIIAKVAGLQGFEAKQRHVEGGGKERVWVRHSKKAKKATAKVRQHEVVPKSAVRETNVDSKPDEVIALPLSRTLSATLTLPSAMTAEQYDVLKVQLDAIVELRKMQTKLLEG